jgi:phosphomevalonate kinase
LIPTFEKKIAGGFDAVWLLVCEPPEDTPGIPPLPRIERLWQSFPGVAPLLAQESKARGVTLERIDDVPGLAAVVNAATGDYLEEEKEEKR